MNVHLALPDGRTLNLRFTWAAVDEIGSRPLTELIAAATAGGAGSLGTLCDLIVLASGGEVTRDALMADPPPLTQAGAALVQAWTIAVQGAPVARRSLWRRIFERGA